MLKNKVFSTSFGLFLLTAAQAFAEDAPAAAPPPSPMNMLTLFGPMILVFYFLIIRPQNKKMRDQQEMQNALKHGDEILTTSGMLGKVTGITDKVVTVEIADDVRVKMLKSQVSQIVKGPVKDLAP